MGAGLDESPSDAIEIGNDGAVLGLEAAPLGVLEAVGGKRKGRELAQSLADVIEALLDHDSGWAERGGRRRWPQGRPRVAQECCALGRRAGRTRCRQERQGLPLLESVTLDDAEQGELVLLRQRAQGRSEGRLEQAAGDQNVKSRSEADHESMAAGDPALAAPEQARDRPEAQPVLPVESVDHARLVHRREGARWGVRAQHEVLELDRARRPLDDRRDGGATLLEPMP